jgi:hypothetical protein
VLGGEPIPGVSLAAASIVTEILPLPADAVKNVLAAAGLWIGDGIARD